MSKDEYLSKLELSKEDMQCYAYKVADAIVEHFDTQHTKSPVVHASREEMDEVFVETLPEEPSDPYQVLQYVLDEVMTHCNVVSHPRSYSFVPGPSNYISAMADSLSSGFNVFAGGWAASPAAAEIEIVTTNWLLQLFGFPVKKGEVFLRAAVPWPILRL